MFKQVTPSIRLFLTDTALYAIDEQEIELLEDNVRDMEKRILDTLKSVLETVEVPWIVLDIFESKGCIFRLRISRSRDGSGNSKPESRVGEEEHYSAEIFRVFTIGKPSALHIGDLRVQLTNPSPRK
jgi:hypothetical protein